MRKTKIICTLGPAVDNEKMLKKLIENGMNVARFNFSHGTHEEQKIRMDRLKKIREEMNAPIAILLDTKGPEIRLKDFEEGEVRLKAKQIFTLDSDTETLGTIDRVGISYGNLGFYLKRDDQILIDDGKIELRVISIDGNSIKCSVINGGVIKNHKSLNVPCVSIPMDYISENDKKDILFGIEQGVDYIASSFTRNPKDVIEIKYFLKENGGDDIKLICKIENTQGVKNLEEIIRLSDGVMIARGDLGVEIPFKEVPALQKSIIEKSTSAGKIVVTATQMLESMTFSPRPTRAEVSDIANAVYDGTTAIMLSGESASGKYPAEAVKTMAEIAETTEKSIDFTGDFLKHSKKVEKTIKDSTCKVACEAAEYVGAKAIVTVTRSGKTGHILSGFRPSCLIIAAVVDPRGMRQLNLAWGVKAVEAVEQETVDALFEYAKLEAMSTGMVSVGDKIVIVTGSGTTKGNVSDTIRICEL